MSVVRDGLSAVMLAGSERPQDARELDVAIRKQEMRRGLEPGGVRLIAEVDSAAGLRALPDILDSIEDRKSTRLNSSH